MPSTRRCVASPLPHGNPLQIEYCETLFCSKLREFMAADLDGNLIRVFYDFRGDT